MAKLDFEHTPNEVWIVEDNNATYFYMTVGEYNNSLNRSAPDTAQEKLDLALDILAELLIPSGVF